MAKSLDTAKPSTQKAAGFKQYLLDTGQSERLTGIFLATSMQEVEEYAYGYPLFARPCPPDPKHGFVESRYCYSLDELKQVYKEALAESPNAELLIHPGAIPVTHNAVICPLSGLIVVGPGNDGATGGKDSQSIVFTPAADATWTDKRNRYTQTKGEGKESEDLFLELIRDGSKSEWINVQARTGPKLLTTKDYIPAQVTVKAVITPTDDLLAWAKQVETLKEGDVVYHPGGSLACHAAVHCVLHNIPYVTSFEPIVGTTLEKRDIEQLPLDAAEFNAGVCIATEQLKEPTQKHQWVPYFQLAISCLHNITYLRQRPSWSRFLGWSLAVLVRQAVTLCHGELRHQSKKHGSDTALSGKDRNTVYFEYSKKTWTGLIDNLFSEHFLHGFNGGFGGAPWFQCAANSQILFRLMQQAAKGEDVTVKLIEQFNYIMTLAHNNGWWFNKFASQDNLDVVAQRPWEYLLQHYPRLLEVFISNPRESVLKPHLEDFLAAKTYSMHPEKQQFLKDNGIAWVGNDTKEPQVNWSNVMTVGGECEAAMTVVVTDKTRYVGIKPPKVKLSFGGAPISATLNTEVAKSKEPIAPKKTPKKKLEKKELVRVQIRDRSAGSRIQILYGDGHIEEDTTLSFELNPDWPVHSSSAGTDAQYYEIPDECVELLEDGKRVAIKIKEVVWKSDWLPVKLEKA